MVFGFLRKSREQLTRARVAADQDEEFRFHLQMETEKNIRLGMAPDEARRVAALAFGSKERFRDETTDARGFSSLENLVRDTRHAARRLRRSPGFSLGVMITLGIGLGAAAGIGAMVHGVLVRDLPYHHPDRLVRIALHTPGLPGTSDLHSTATYAQFASDARSFEGLAAYWTFDAMTLTIGDASERVTAGFVTPGTFALLGAQLLAGHGFAPGDTAWVESSPVLISEDLWERRLNRDPDVVGTTLQLNRGARTIIGVLPRSFDFPAPDVQVWYPARITFERPSLAERYVGVIGRLRPGVTPAAAQLELNTLLPRLSARYPNLTAEVIQRAAPAVSVESLKAAVIAPVRAQLLLLGGMVLVVLVVATCNVVNLFLLRAERASKEVAIATSLGATRLAIARRFGVEGMLLGLASILIAIPLASLMLVSRLGFSVRDIPRIHELSFGWGLAAVISLVAIVIGAGVGMTALVRTGSFSRDQLVRAVSRTTSSRSWRRTQQALVATQVAMALSLVIVAGLLGRSFWNLRNAELGFVPDGLTTFEVALPFGERYGGYANMVAFHARVSDALRAQPGVTGVAAVSRVPLSAVGGPDLRYKFRALDVPGGVAVFERAAIATSEYFDVMRIPIIRGRSFAAGDMRGEPGVVLSEALALQLFNATDVLGRRLQYMNDRGRTLSFHVIGVAGNVPNARIEDGPSPLVYFPQLRDGDGLPPDSLPIPVNAREVQYVVRSTIPLSAQAIQRLVHGIDPGVPAVGLRSVDGIVDAATARVRLTLLLLGVSGAAALLLGIVGVYSVASYAAAQREREFGVRLALGAAPEGVTRLVLREGAGIAASGIASGILIAWSAGRLLTALLYRVSPASITEFIAGVSLISVVVMVATLVPARRASRTDPAIVLRGE